MNKDTIETRVGLKALSIIRNELYNTIKEYKTTPLDILIKYNKLDLYIKYYPLYNNTVKK